MHDGIDFIKAYHQINKAVCFFAKNCNEFNPKGKKSAILVYENPQRKQDARPVGTGNIKYAKYLEIAQRKIQQLHDNPSHLTSYLSRDPENGLYGGGINLLEFGKIALSGLTEHGDEACLLNGLYSGSFISYTFVDMVLQQSNNFALFEKIRKGMGQ